jgi:hypothetical protein
VQETTRSSLQDFKTYQKHGRKLNFACFFLSLILLKNKFGNVIFACLRTLSLKPCHYCFQTHSFILPTQNINIDWCLFLWTNLSNVKIYCLWNENKKHLSHYSRYCPFNMEIFQQKKLFFALFSFVKPFEKVHKVTLRNCILLFLCFRRFFFFFLIIFVQWGVCMVNEWKTRRRENLSKTAKNIISRTKNFFFNNRKVCESEPLHHLTLVHDIQQKREFTFAFCQHKSRHSPIASPHESLT